MRAAVYRGPNQVQLEELPTPSIGSGEVLVEIEACGVCGTDLKKIAHGDLPPPLVFGHEVGGRIAAVGQGVTSWKSGDRVLFFHHIPCRQCRFCQTREYAQCLQYKKVGTTAGFKPAGGGFAEKVRVMDWIVREGLVRIPDDVEAEEATFVEPVNTCLKGIQKAGPLKDQAVLIFGAGPIGLILLQLARLEGAQPLVVDPIPERLEVAKHLGAEKVMETVPKLRGLSPFDIALVATAASSAVQEALCVVRPAGRVVLFAQTRLNEMVPLDVGQIGKLEKTVVGSYSASVDLQAQAADLVFKRKIQVKPLITHRFGLDQIEEALRIAMAPSGQSLKILITPRSNGGLS